MHIQEKHNSGFAVVQLIVIVVVLGVAGFIGWYVYDNRTKTITTANVTKESPKKTTTAEEDRKSIISAIKAECVIAYNQDENLKQYNITDANITVEIRNDPELKAYQVIGDYARVNAFCEVANVTSDELGSGKTYYLSKQDSGDWIVDQSGQQSTAETEQVSKDLGYPDYQ